MDKDLGAAIDKAGRSKVFSIAADNGWTAGNPPPKWVWWQICEQINQQSHREAMMGDHRVSIKINFEMHGLKRKHECWLNWSDGIPQSFSDMIEGWKDEAMDKFLQEDLEYQEQIHAAKQRKIEAEEREILAKLKEKYS